VEVGDQRFEGNNNASAIPMRALDLEGYQIMSLEREKARGVMRALFVGELSRAI
jgi:hypothetical protein